MKPFHVELIYNKNHYIINVEYRTTFIIGDSATGKTQFCKDLIGKNAKITSPIAIGIINSLSAFEGAHDICYFCDLDTIENLSVIKRILKVDSVANNIYFVFFGRKYLHNVPVPIGSLYEFKEVQGITKNVQKYFEELHHITPITVESIAIEDSKSGLQFMQSVTDTAWSFNGAPNFRELRKGNCLAFIDALGFGGYIEEFLRILTQCTNVQLVMWKSFEYFILKHVMKVDWEPDGINPEEECTQKLRQVTNGFYSKDTGCCGTACFHCPNTCKNTNCAKILYAVYPDLKDKIVKPADVLSEYLEKFEQGQPRDLELVRLINLAQKCNCPVEDIVRDLI